MISSPATASPPRPPRPQTDLNAARRLRKRRALACLIAVAGCVTIADLLLKRGALSAHADGAASGGVLQTLGVGALASPFTIAGIVFHLLGLMAWLYTLRNIPLVLAYSFTAVQQATVALGAWLYLGERITALRWAGIVAVLVGVIVLVPTIVAVERTGRPVAEGREE